MLDGFPKGESPEVVARTEGSARQTMRVIMLGSTGTVGQATLSALLRRGHHVSCFVRPTEDGLPPACFRTPDFSSVDFRFGDVTDEKIFKEQGLRGDTFDAIVSCLASRTGAPDDAWAIDYQAHSHVLRAAKNAGLKHMVLLSAICVQKPRLAFQHAKLAFEKELIESGLCYSIVRPTALFKSLSGQIERVRKGKSFLMFGNGALTACKPISDRDLGNFMVQCLEDESLHYRVLPIGGPGPALTPKQQGDALFALLGRTPRYTHVPVGLLSLIIKTLSLLGVLRSSFLAKAELARIGKYYVTESMLYFDPDQQRYDADQTPSTGTDHLFAYYKDVIHSGAKVDLGQHAIFKK